MKLFIYGTLKRGYCRAQALDGQTFLEGAVTTADYRIYNTGSYPALVADAEGIEIEGELWEVDESCLPAVDAVEGAPELFERRTISLKQPATDAASAYFYHGAIDGMPDCGRRWE